MTSLSKHRASDSKFFTGVDVPCFRECLLLFHVTMLCVTHPASYCHVCRNVLRILKVRISPPFSKKKKHTNFIVVVMWVIRSRRATCFILLTRWLMGDVKWRPLFRWRGERDKIPFKHCYFCLVVLKIYMSVPAKRKYENRSQNKFTQRIISYLRTNSDYDYIMNPSPSDYRVFPPLKQISGDNRFEDDRQVETMVTRWLITEHGVISPGHTKVRPAIW